MLKAWCYTKFLLSNHSQIKKWEVNFFFHTEPFRCLIYVLAFAGLKDIQHFRYLSDILAADQDHYFKGNIPFPSNILVKKQWGKFQNYGTSRAFLSTNRVMKDYLHITLVSFLLTKIYIYICICIFLTRWIFKKLVVYVRKMKAMH